MTGAIVLILLLLGLVMIVKGGDIFVDAATWIAEKTGIPKFIIGATIVSLATTLPEMMVSLLAASKGQVDMAIGNAIGSVTANLGLILGIAVIFMPGIIHRREYLLKSLLMLLASAILMVFGFTGAVGQRPQIALLIIFAIAMADNVWQGKFADGTLVKNPSGCPDKTVDILYMDNKEQALAYEEGGTLKAAALTGAGRNAELWINVGKLAAGAAAIIIGSRLLVDNGTILAVLMGVPERIIAITIIAVGTSLPEMVTTISAIIKKQSALSIGNIIGANIMDLTLILPASSLVARKALPVSSQFASADIPACFIIGLVAVLPTLIARRFMRWQGFLLMGLYVLYLVYSVMFV